MDFAKHVCETYSRRNKLLAKRIHRWRNVLARRNMLAKRELDITSNSVTWLTDGPLLGFNLMQISFERNQKGAFIKRNLEGACIKRNVIANEA